MMANTCTYDCCQKSPGTGEGNIAPFHPYASFGIPLKWYSAALFKSIDLLANDQRLKNRYTPTENSLSTLNLFCALI